MSCRRRTEQHEHRVSMFLNCHTAFSFKYGTLMPEALVAEARRCGVAKIAVTDINNTAALIELLRITSGAGQTPEIIAGMEFREDNRLRYVLIARNNTGFEQINRFRSRHNTTGNPCRHAHRNFRKPSSFIRTVPPNRQPCMTMNLLAYVRGNVTGSGFHRKPGTIRRSSSFSIP